MNQFTHHLSVVHDREPATVRMAVASSESSVAVDASSTDLTEAWREILSRMPPDTYAALIASLQTARKS